MLRFILMTLLSLACAGVTLSCVFLMLGSICEVLAESVNWALGPHDKIWTRRK